MRTRSLAVCPSGLAASEPFPSTSFCALLRWVPVLLLGSFFSTPTLLLQRALPQSLLLSCTKALEKLVDRWRPFKALLRHMTKFDAYFAPEHMCNLLAPVMQRVMLNEGEPRGGVLVTHPSLPNLVCAFFRLRTSEHSPPPIHQSFPPPPQASPRGSSSIWLTPTSALSRRDASCLCGQSCSTGLLSTSRAAASATTVCFFWHVAVE